MVAVKSHHSVGICQSIRQLEALPLPDYLDTSHDQVPSSNDKNKWWAGEVLLAAWAIIKSNNPIIIISVARTSDSDFDSPTLRWRFFRTTALR